MFFFQQRDDAVPSAAAVLQALSITQSALSLRIWIGNCLGDSASRERPERGNLAGGELLHNVDQKLRAA